jgi:hypothetical protein
LHHHKEPALTELLNTFQKAFERFSKIGLKASAVFQKPALPITPKAFAMIECERFYQN